MSARRSLISRTASISGAPSANGRNSRIGDATLLTKRPPAELHHDAQRRRATPRVFLPRPCDPPSARHLPAVCAASAQAEIILRQCRARPILAAISAITGAVSSEDRLGVPARSVHAAGAIIFKAMDQNKGDIDVKSRHADAEQQESPRRICVTRKGTGDRLAQFLAVPARHLHDQGDGRTSTGSSRSTTCRARRSSISRRRATTIRRENIGSAPPTGTPPPSTSWRCARFYGLDEL